MLKEVKKLKKWFKEVNREKWVNWKKSIDKNERINRTEKHELIERNI